MNRTRGYHITMPIADVHALVKTLGYRFRVSWKKTGVYITYYAREPTDLVEFARAFPDYMHLVKERKVLFEEYDYMHEWPQVPHPQSTPGATYMYWEKGNYRWLYGRSYEVHIGIFYKELEGVP